MKFLLYRIFVKMLGQEITYSAILGAKIFFGVRYGRRPLSIAYPLEFCCEDTRPHSRIDSYRYRCASVISVDRCVNYVDEPFMCYIWHVRYRPHLRNSFHLIYSLIHSYTYSFSKYPTAEAAEFAKVCRHRRGTEVFHQEVSIL